MIHKKSLPLKSCFCLTELEELLGLEMNKEMRAGVKPLIEL